MTTMTSGTSSDALYLLHEGTQYQSYRFLGSHVEERDAVKGVHFAVWAPNAKQVNVSGSFNGWDGQHHAMAKADGVWTLFIPELKEGTLYKYEIITSDNDCYLKSDPYAFSSELRPGTASIVTSLEGYAWQDEDWLARKTSHQFLQQPLLIYEVHLGSWKRKEGGGFYSYGELADELVDYVVDHGFTHIELMPLMEHPLDKSWGYQITGYYSVTSRFGTPQEFMYLVDRCHQRGIGVIMDWVPAHFCKDAHGLSRFDGKPLYEYEDSRKGEQPTWGTHIFDYGKPEVHSFLISNALFWMDVYHIDGLRVDAVYSMLTLNFDRSEEDRITNNEGGEENLEGIAFLQKLNAVVFARYPNALMMAEDSSSFPGVTKPVEQGGLGFNYKWNLSFTWNTLDYMKKNQEQRSGLEPQLTKSLQQAWDENYILPYAHDEMANPDKSLLGKMSGSDSWQRFANLRVLYAYLIGHPGKKLLFMGSEFGQEQEWDSEAALTWDVLQDSEHEQFKHFVKTLNHFYISEKALWERDYAPDGFEGIDFEDTDDGLVLFGRKGEEEEALIMVCNFRPEAHEGYRIGVKEPAQYREVFNSDCSEFGGSGVINESAQTAEEWSCQNQPYSITVTIPPLAAVIFKNTKWKDEMIMKKQECVAMLLAGGEGSRLRPLTKYMAKPAVHFGAKYRMIDFALSNCRNSGIGTVGVLTQYKPAVLHAHIGSGDAWQVEGADSRNSGISILERQAGAPNAYKGTADAIYQNLAYLQEHNPRYVLILSGDHIYHMDYRTMLEHHQATGADATISVMPVKWEETSRFGIVSADEQHRITAFAEKPFKAASNLASMGIYVFNWEFLRSCLEQDAVNPVSSHDFGHDIIPGLLAAGAHVSAYPFEGYWKDVGTIESLWESHMDLLGYDPRLQVDQEAWPVRTAKRSFPESQVALDARVNNAEIGDGVSIYGNVSHSVLFDGVTVGEHSRVLNSVIMPGVQIGKHALILNAIIGEGSIIKDGAIVGKPGNPGVTVVAEKTVVGRHYPASIPAALTGTRLNFV